METSFKIKDAYERGYRVGQGKDIHIQHLAWYSHASKAEQAAYNQGRLDGVSKASPRY